MDRVTTPFGATSTAAEVLAGVDLTGRSAVVTGGSSGIGLETARTQAGAGAAVTLAVRDLEAGRAAAAAIVESTGNQNVHVARVDLADLDSVAAFARSVDDPLDVLVNNAGVMMTPETYTPAGWELQFATNHLGHFALALGLHGALVAAGSARVVSVSSSGHRSSPILFEDLVFNQHSYDTGLAYGQSKTAQVLFAVEATSHWSHDGITTNALMPGGVWTQLQRHWDPDTLAAARAQVPATDETGMGVKSPEQGAATSVLLAAWPGLEGMGGRYFEDCREAEVVPRISDGLHGVAHALDPDAAARLWDISLALLQDAG